MFWTKRKTGAIEDYRPQEAKDKDFLFKEIVASADLVNWTEKAPSEWRNFSIKDQDGSGSCVMQSTAKLCEVLYFNKSGKKVPFSANHYKYRNNFPAEGMWGTDAFDVWRKQGIPLEQLSPSQKLSEDKMNTVEISSEATDTALIFKIDNYVQFTAGQDFETIASTIQKTGKAVMVWFRFNYNEWTDIPTIKTDSPKLHHSVACVDFTLYKGKKYLVIEDSWGNFNAWQGRRLISEEFFAARNTFAAYPLTFKFFTTDVKPSYTGTIVSLQDCLKHYGTFPTNVESTGVLGAVTKKAISLFQVKEGLHPTGTGSVGSLTKAKLEELYP